MKPELTELVSITGLSLVDDHETRVVPLTPVLNPKRAIWGGSYDENTIQPIFGSTASRLRYHAEPHPVEVEEPIEDFLPWLSLSISEKVQGLFIDVSFEISHWADEAPLKNTLYRLPALLDETIVWYVVRITADQTTENGITNSRGETLLGRLANTRLRSSILKQWIPAVTPKVALEYMLEQFKIQHPWFIYGPVPDLTLVDGQQSPLAINGMTCLADSSSGKYLRDFLEEYFRAFAGRYFFRDDQGIFVVKEIGAGVVNLSVDDFTSIEEAGAEELVNSVELKTTAYTFEPGQIVAPESQAIITTDQMFSGNSSPKDSDRDLNTQNIGLAISVTDNPPGAESGKIARLTESIFNLQFGEGIVVGENLQVDLVLKRWAWQGGASAGSLSQLSVLDRPLSGLGGEILLHSFSSGWDNLLFDDYFPITLVTFEVYGEVIGGSTLRLRVRHQLSNKLRQPGVIGGLGFTRNQQYGCLLIVNIQGDTFTQSGVTYTFKEEDAENIEVNGVWSKLVEIPVISLTADQASEIAKQYLDTSPALNRKIELVPPYNVHPFDLGKTITWPTGLNAPPFFGSIKGWDHTQDYRSDPPSSRTSIIVHCEVEDET